MKYLRNETKKYKMRRRSRNWKREKEGRRGGENKVDVFKKIENIQLINNKKYNENIYNNCNIVIILNG